MRRPISKSDMERYFARTLSNEELIEFEARLRESGFEPDVARPSASTLFESLRPDRFESPFEEETLLTYVKGGLDPDARRVIGQIRRVDADLDETLSAMETAQRQIETSLQLASPPRKRASVWTINLRWGFAGAAAVAVAMVIFYVGAQRNSPGVPAPSLEALLSSQDFTSSTSVLPTGQEALDGGAVTPSADAAGKLTSLATPTKDPAHMVPARCLVLPVVGTRLTWQGIRAKKVTCSLYDSTGAVLASATVTTNTWMYRKQLAAGDYHWSAQWTGKDGKQKTATRMFRVVDAAEAQAVEKEMARAGDAVSRSVVLARNGYTYQSLQMIDGVEARTPSMSGLKQLRERIASQAIL